MSLEHIHVSFSSLMLLIKYYVNNTYIMSVSNLFTPGTISKGWCDPSVKKINAVDIECENVNISNSISGAIDTGTFTPIPFNETNVGVFIFNQSFYRKIDNIVICHLYYQANYAAPAAQLTEWKFNNLPVPKTSNFSLSDNVVGVGSLPRLTNGVFPITASAEYGTKNIVINTGPVGTPGTYSQNCLVLMYTVD